MKLGQSIAIVFAAGALSLLAGYGVHHWIAPRHSDTVRPDAAAVRPQLSQLPLAVLTGLDGGAHNLGKWRGHVIVLNFWASWCPPCRSEMPVFIALQNEYGARGLQILGVAVDDPEDAREFADSIGINFPVLLGSTDAIDLSQQLGNRFSGLPFTVVFDRDGLAVLSHGGEISRERLEQTITPLL